ncbi:hypothetical protein BGZ58_003085 [Dissophora ornata]|nr:hypothetical protein BGZ58_003085 [Dissophora ornata]
MAEFFQLARVRRSPNPTHAPWTFDVPEEARKKLDSLIDPLAVVSYFSCSQSVQDTLWAVVFEQNQGACSGGSEYNRNTDSLSAGIWAWLPDPSTDTAAQSKSIRTLHLVHRAEKNAITESQGPEGQHADDINNDEDDDKSASHDLDKILGPLLALCSTQLNIISATIHDTEADLAQLSQSLMIFTAPQKQRHTKQADLASLTWRWSDQMDGANDISTNTNGHRTANAGWVTLESLSKSTQNDPGESEAHLDVLRQCFGLVDCHLPTASTEEKQDIDKILEQDLRDLTVSGDGKNVDHSSNKVDVNTAWFRGVFHDNEMIAGDLDLYSDNSRVLNGAMLCAKLQACLLQLNALPPLFNALELRQSTDHLVRKHALYIGARTYYQIMNEHLDRRPIPMPWHTLAMVHNDAQSKALEEIERHYYGTGSYLPRLLREFRAHCLETTITGVDSESQVAGSAAAAAAAASAFGSVSAMEMMVPSGGLYLAYHSANATALQNHHLDSLDEHWDVFLKSRISENQGSMSTTASRSSTQIKDFSEFLQAVDQVRRSYLETCIPSPEAISVLENLDEMQQSKSAIFLQSITATSPSTPSPGILPTHLKRSSSISSSRHSMVLSGNAIGLPSVNSGLRGGDVLTDTLNGKSTRIQAINTANGVGIGSGIGGSSSSSGGRVQQRQLDQAPMDSEQQILEILKAKRRSKVEDRRVSLDIEPSGATGQRDAYYGANREQGSGSALAHGTTAGSHTSRPSGSALATGEASSSNKENEKAVVQFGWTLHMLHANTLQYAWIWSWLYAHEGSSQQNVGKFACDSKIYTSSKWIILPAKDLIRSRKEWKVTYGDRVWLVSYWFSTRNARTDLPEYLPRARGAPCRHVIPYGETYVICKTCPADALCMRCFRASDHTDHIMYLQCSWGTSVCACGDPLRLKMSNALHCSLHSAESQRSYSRLAKGKPCQIKFKAGEKVYRCKIAEDGMTCSCHDGKSWKLELRCAYHSPGALEREYLPRAITVPAPSPSPWVRQREQHHHHHEGTTSPIDKHNDTSLSSTTTEKQPLTAIAGSSTTSLSWSSHEHPHRCGHVFQPGEDIYHCRDCSFHETVILCSRCFHASGCVNHRWRMGAFQPPEPDLTSGPASGSPSSNKIVDGLKVAGDKKSPSEKDAQVEKHIQVSCDCGDPAMFKTSFDCNYHLPQEFRPVPNLVHCDYLFQRGEIMYRCRTCHFVDEKDSDKDEPNASDVQDGSSEQGSDIWICGRCFDPEDHHGHAVEELTNERNEGFYCHCGDPTILRSPPNLAANSGASAATGGSLECRDDHNRQNVLCTANIGEGMVYYQCKHERVGGTNIVHRCQYRAFAGEWIAFCNDCYPSQEGMVPAYLCFRCRQGSDHKEHTVKWVKAETDMLYPCACGSHSLSRLSSSSAHAALASSAVSPLSSPSSHNSPVNNAATNSSASNDKSNRNSSGLASSTSSAQIAITDESTIKAPSLCQYHTMIYKTTPSTTLYLHSHNYRSFNHQDHNEVTGYRYHDSDNDWIISRPDGSGGAQGADAECNSATTVQAATSGRQLSPYLQWKDVFWLKHANTGRFFNSMASLKVTQGFQEVSALEGTHSNNDWIVEETTWLRQQILNNE